MGIAETKVAAFLSDENIGSDIDDIDGYPVQVLLKKGITRSLKAIRFTILSCKSLCYRFIGVFRYRFFIM